METITKFKNFTEEYLPVFTNFQLTELITLKTGKKKEFADRVSVFNAIDSLIVDYGISFFGATYLRNLDGTTTDTQLRYMWINRNMPHENIGLIEQFYGWDDAIIDIGIGSNDSNCQWSFDLNTLDKSCKLKQNVYSTVRQSMNFETFEEMLGCINLVEDLNTLF